MNYAVITKAKAMYGKRLKDSDINMLCDCRSVEDCAAFLRSHPAYTKAFEGTELRGIRLSRIEMLLKREYCLEFERLIKGMSEKERKLTQMFIGTYELDLIMWALRNTGLDAEQKAPLPPLYVPLIRKYSKTDFDLLINSRTRQQVAQALNGHYRNIVEKSVSDDGETDYFTTENELWKAFYASLSEYIEKNFKKDDAASMFGTCVDLYNIMRIFRLKEYFGFLADQISPFIIRPLYKLNDDTVSKLCTSSGIREFVSILKKTHYKQLCNIKNGEQLESLCNEIMVKKASKLLHFSTSAPAVIYAYLIYKSHEIDKIKTVIESVRYNLSREMIESYVGTKAKTN